MQFVRIRRICQIYSISVARHTGFFAGSPVFSACYHEWSPASRLSPRIPSYLRWSLRYGIHVINVQNNLEFNWNHQALIIFWAFEHSHVFCENRKSSQLYFPKQWNDQMFIWIRRKSEIINLVFVLHSIYNPVLYPTHRIIRWCAMIDMLAAIISIAQ